MKRIFSVGVLAVLFSVFSGSAEAANYSKITTFQMILDDGNTGGSLPSLVEKQYECLKAGRICNIWSGIIY